MYLTHNIGSASALPIMNIETFTRERTGSPGCQPLHGKENNLDSKKSFLERWRIERQASSLWPGGARFKYRLHMQLHALAQSLSSAALSGREAAGLIPMISDFSHHRPT